MTFKPDAETPEERLLQLKKMMRDSLPRIKTPGSSAAVNNHIHTTYSFSPYSPSAAVRAARLAGLETAGLMDHDTVAGANEFLQAASVSGLAVTVGMECRAHFDFTPAAGRRINNPDQSANCYLAIHGIPHSRLAAVQKWFAPCIEARLERTRNMTDKLNLFSGNRSLRLDFDREVLPLSLLPRGGTITERHLCFALARKLLSHIGRGPPLISFLKEEWKLNITGKSAASLLSAESEFYDYLLLGVLKSSLVEKFYLPAMEESPDIRDVVRFALQVGAIPAYAYLGDITDSVTGDKKPEKFEDDFLDELFQEICKIGFPAVTYMPARNSLAQLARVQALCAKHGLFQISGEDINSPGQPFVCPILQKPEFYHLVNSTWALIGHEREATRDLEKGMFSPTTIARFPGLAQRIAFFADKGRQTYSDIN